MRPVGRKPPCRVCRNAPHAKAARGSSCCLSVTAKAILRLDHTANQPLTCSVIRSAALTRRFCQQQSLDRKLGEEPIENGCMIERQSAPLAMSCATRGPIENPYGDAACVDECFLEVGGLRER